MKSFKPLPSGLVEIIKMSEDVFHDEAMDFHGCPQFPKNAHHEGGVQQEHLWILSF